MTSEEAFEDRITNLKREFIREVGGALEAKALRFTTSELDIDDEIDHGTYTQVCLSSLFDMAYALAYEAGIDDLRIEQIKEASMIAAQRVPEQTH